MALKRGEKVIETPKQEVVQVPVTDGKILWQKIGGGSFLFNNKIIKPGEKFRARPEDIPKAFKNVIIALEQVPEPGKQLPTIGKKPLFRKEIISKKEIDKLKKDDALDSDFDTEAEWYNIVNGSGKKLNPKPLTDEQADELLNDLSK